MVAEVVDLPEPDDGRPYHAVDVTPLVDPVGWVRDHPERFLGRGFTPSNELLLTLVHQCLWDLAPDGRVDCEVRDDWGYLACTVDWLEGGSRNPFREVVPFPESGIANSMRPEVIVTAFSTVAATLVAGDEAVDVLTGDRADVPSEAVAYARALLGGAGRAIILRV